MAWAEEKRKFSRYRYAGEIHAGHPGDADLLEGQVEDLSLGGCLLRFADTTDFQKEDDLEISFRSSYIAFRATGTVRRRAEKGCLIGVSFLRLSHQGREDLQELIGDLKERQSASKKHSSCA